MKYWAVLGILTFSLILFGCVNQGSESSTVEKYPASVSLSFIPATFSNNCRFMEPCSVSFQVKNNGYSKISFEIGNRISGAPEIDSNGIEFLQNVGQTAILEPGATSSTFNIVFLRREKVDTQTTFPVKVSFTLRDENGRYIGVIPQTYGGELTYVQNQSP